MLDEELATQEREKTRKCELMNARTIAKSVAQQDATFDYTQDCKKQMNLEMASYIAAYREYKQKEQQLRAMEERRTAEYTLQANKDADRAYRDSQKLVVQRKREERMVMDNALHQQIAQKHVQEQLRMRDEAAFDQRHFKVLAQEDLEFQMYAKGVIDAAEDANRNTIPLQRGFRQGIGLGLGPISGGIRANYLVPGARHCQLPEYVNCTACDMGRLNRIAQEQSPRTRLGFTW
ncbi:hypothetical protein AAFF_G00147660 [Aldrovandia affinis]|uniref:Uncharacterized protein n=1 Tax=Aldrovandia affinis TaxID=143900 RepID=A0AAD7W942_9TELE|nr:hypothetical protein AAFF_G00147660 [Aldrovandia affinis]